jgi:hypothetical protein
VLADLISDTLDASAEISAASVVDALSPLRGIGPALIAAGHLESTPVVVVSGLLHVSITVATGAAVSSVEENLNPVPGGASATQDWTLHLPNPATFAAALAAITNRSPHLSVEPAPTEDDSSDKMNVKAGLVDLAALRGLRASS